MGRVHRRICFLRLEGREAEARRVEDGELATAVTEARKAADSDAEADSLLRSVTSEDEERVAGAIAFAEVLMPMLSERLKLQSPAGAPLRPPSQKRPAHAEAGEARGIADFIDEMLEQERAGTR